MNSFFNRFCLMAAFALSLGLSAKAADHTVTVEIHALRGEVGAHFSRYDGQTKVEADIKGVNIRVPTGGSRFTKIANRDDSSSRITPGKPWIATFKVSGPGVYILDLSDWARSPEAVVKLTIDGIVRFQGKGTAGNFDGWQDKTYGPRTRKTDDREVAIDLE